MFDVAFSRRMCLLAGLEREHEAAPPVAVHGLAGDAARHAPYQAHAAREVAEQRSAEARRVARLWPSPTTMSAPVAPGGSSSASAIGSQWRSRARRRRAQRVDRLRRFEQAEEVGMLVEHARHVRAERRFEILGATWPPRSATRVRSCPSR
jgi:hypothetical protein